MKIVEGNLTGSGLRVALVASRFNSFIVDRLVEGAVDGLRRTGVADDAITLYRAPGSWELPQVARRVLDKGGIDALITLGAVIRGGTPHFDYVCRAVTDGVREAARDTGVPVAFGVLTVDDLDQALERAGGAHGNKGAEAATVAVEMARQAQVPVTFGVLTCDTVEQAIERAGTKAGNKGFEAAMAAIEMASLYKAMKG
jgi:6,7-dimethyl-8-ribityllumazine synthase